MKLSHAEDVMLGTVRGARQPQANPFPPPTHVHFARWALRAICSLAFLSGGLKMSYSVEPPTPPATNRPTWMHPGIEQMRPAEDLRLKLPPVDPYHKLLTEEPDFNSATNYRLPTIPRLADLSSQSLNAAGTATNLTARLEYMRTSEAVSHARDYARRGKLDEAISVLTAVLPKVAQPDNRFRILHRLGSYMFRARRYTEAIRYMSLALELRPGNTSLASNLAAALMTAGKVDRALEVLSSIQTDLVVRPSLRFTIFFNYACAYSLKNRPEDAIAALRQAASAAPDATLASIGDVQLDSIRTLPEFRELVRRLNEGLPPVLPVVTNRAEATARPAPLIRLTPPSGSIFQRPGPNLPAPHPIQAP